MKYPMCIIDAMEDKYIVLKSKKWFMYIIFYLPKINTHNLLTEFLRIY